MLDVIVRGLWEDAPTAHGQTKKFCYADDMEMYSEWGRVGAGGGEQGPNQVQPEEGAGKENLVGWRSEGKVQSSKMFSKTIITRLDHELELTSMRRSIELKSSPREGSEKGEKAGHL